MTYILYMTEKTAAVSERRLRWRCVSPIEPNESKSSGNVTEMRFLQRVAAELQECRSKHNIIL